MKNTQNATALPRFKRKAYFREKSHVKAMLKYDRKMISANLNFD